MLETFLWGVLAGSSFIVAGFHLGRFMNRRFQRSQQAVTQHFVSTNRCGAIWKTDQGHQHTCTDVEGHDGPHRDGGWP